MNTTSGAPTKAPAANDALKSALAAAAFDRVAGALDEGPDDPQILNAAGLAALRAGKLALSRSLFDRALIFDPKATALWLNRATADRQLGDEAAELASLDGALATDQLSIVAWLRKAQILERKGDAVAAVKAWGAVVGLRAQITQSTPALEEAVAHGTAFLADHRSKLSARIADALGDRLLPRLRAGAEAMLGIRKIYTNECAGFHFPFLPASEFFDRDFFPWMPALEAKAAEIRAECEALSGEGARFWRPYVEMEEGTPTNKWTALNKSKDWSAGFLWEYGKPNASILDRCPATAAALAALPLAAIPSRGPTAFFSILRAGAHIPPHTGVSNLRAIIHLALIVPPGCEFRVGGETRTWREGTAFAFDDTIEHEAHNPSPYDRAVLIFDVWNPWLSAEEIDGVKAMFEVVGPSIP